MAKEANSYRDILEDLHEYFGDKGMLTKGEVARYLGRDPKTVTKWFGIGKNGISTPKLARLLAAM